MTLRIGILETGRPPEDLLNRHGDYPQLVDEWVAPLFNNVWTTSAWPFAAAAFNGVCPIPLQGQVAPYSSKTSTTST